VVDVGGRVRRAARAGAVLAWAVYGLVATGLTLAASSAGSDAGSDASASLLGPGGTLDAAPDGSAPRAVPENDCCTPSTGAGCADPEVLRCVCEGDPFCCSDAFDALCVRQALTRCEQVCALPPPVSDCCSASSTPGCVLPEIAACVCSVDPACCSVRFDQNCVHLANARCELGCDEQQVSP